MVVDGVPEPTQDISSSGSVILFLGRLQISFFPLFSSLLFPSPLFSSPLFSSPLFSSFLFSCVSFFLLFSCFLRVPFFLFLLLLSVVVPSCFVCYLSLFLFLALGAGLPIGVRLRHMMSAEDEALADRIQAAKETELSRMRQQEAERVLSVALRHIKTRRRSLQGGADGAWMWGSESVMWPWELRKYVEQELETQVREEGEHSVLLQLMASIGRLHGLGSSSPSLSSSRRHNGLEQSTIPTPTHGGNRNRFAPLLKRTRRSRAVSRGPSQQRRRLLDTFGDSLRFVNLLFNRHFSRAQRKVPAHMPHFIDKNIMAELQSIFPQEYDATSSHRFRSPQDMQYSFAYFYFVTHQVKVFDLKREFEEVLDMDGDGELDAHELRHLTRILYGRNARIDAEDVQEVFYYMRNCTVQYYNDNLSRYLFLPAKLRALSDLDADVPVLLESFEACPDVVGKLRTQLAGKKYPHESGSMGDVEFFMVGDNFTMVQDRLDHIRLTTPKFICLNDDMNKTHDPDPRVVQALHDFYLSYFPTPCAFELPPEKYHQQYHLDDILAAEGAYVESSSVFSGTTYVVLLLAALVLAYFTVRSCVCDADLSQHELKHT